jgi:hypothetical protein
MPDTYLDSSVVGFDHQDGLDLKIDTYKRLSPILNAEDAPAINDKFAENLSIFEEPSQKIPDIKSIPLQKALISDDPVVKQFAIDTWKKQTQQNPEFKYGLGRSIESPLNRAEKYMDKDYGYSALRNNEDFYYRNDYMNDGFFMRNFVKNPARFLARVAVPAVLKFGEGLGYIGSMLTSIGSDNYWADVADNGFAKWLEGLEQSYKDHVIPVYKQAGFDDKGFFSKLGDWSFWNDSVADGVAFMASAAIPGSGIAKLGALGKLGAFAEEFSTVTRLGKLASKVGVGSWAELSSLTFNTAMESAQEASGVFKDVKQRMEDKRDAGDPEYVNLSDEQIRERAGKLARNTFLGNVPVLLFSNAFENTLFFKPFKKVEGKAALQIDNSLNVGSKALTNLESESFWKSISSPLSRTVYYGKQAAEGTLMEGLWEENAQLAIQRMNEDDKNYSGFLGSLKGFGKQLGHQTLAALSGKDEEAAENIGLGALIGIGGAVGMSKLAGERKEVIHNTKDAIAQAKTARQNLFSFNDIYTRDENNNIVYENNEPKIDPKKLDAKRQQSEKVFAAISTSNKDDFFNSNAVEFTTKKALGDYIKSLVNIGVENISDKFSHLNAETASLVGMDPRAINKKAGEFVELAKTFEQHAKDINELPNGKKPDNVSLLEFAQDNNARKAITYNNRVESTIISQMAQRENSKLLEMLNKERGVNNSSLSDFTIDQLNFMLYQSKLNNDILKSKDFSENMSELEKQYHIDRGNEIKEKIAKYKQDNELALKDAKRLESGVYVPTITDPQGNTKEVTQNKQTSELKKRLADYDNIVSKNQWFDNLLSDPKEGYNNYLKLQDTPLNKKYKDILSGKVETPITKITKNYRELQEGDFAKVHTLVAKMAFGENQQYSDEELQLQKNYSKLIEEMLAEYGQVVDESRVKILNKKLDSLKAKQSNLLDKIFEKNHAISQKRNEIDNLVQQLQQAISTGTKADRKVIEDTLKKLQDDIYTVEGAIENWNKELASVDYQIGLLEQEITSGNLTGLKSQVDELKKEKAWVENKIEETKGILAKLEKLIKDLLKIAKSLFGKNWNLKFLDKVFHDSFYGEQNRRNYNEDILSAYDEINLNKSKKEELENYIKELQDSYKSIENQLSIWEKEIQDIFNETEKFFKNKYIDLTKQQPVKPDATDNTITNNLTKDKGAFPGGVNSQGIDYQEEQIYDGQDYIRPLHTKFFTATFPAGDPSTFPQDVKDYMDFAEFVTNPKNATKLKKALGKGKLKLLVVTRNNVKEAGLEQVLKDKEEFFAKEKADETHFELVPVIEDEGFLYYVDSKLKKLGKVGETTSINKEQIKKDKKESEDFLKGIPKMSSSLVEKNIESLVKNKIKTEDEIVKYVEDFIKATGEEGIKKIGLTSEDKLTDYVYRKLLTEVANSDIANYDKQLKSSGKSKSNLSNSIVRTSLRLPRFSAKEEQQYLAKNSEADLQNAVKVATDWREQVLAQTKLEPNTTFDFFVTNGIANKQKMQDGSQAKNPVVGTLLDEDQINGQSVRVYSKGEKMLNGVIVSLPAGMPFIYTNNGVFEQLHYANNAKLNDEQVKVVSTVLEEMMKDHISKLNNIIENNPAFPAAKKELVKKVGGIEKLSLKDKKEVFVAATSIPGIQLFNSNYTNFLSSIVYFTGKREKDEAGKYKPVHKNQIYFVGSKLFFGENLSIDLTDPSSVQNSEVQEFLKSQFHNIKYFPNTDTANREYTEYYLEGNKLKNRTWKTYAHYLLSEKNPDGSKRTSIPVTTAIKTEEQHKVENTTEPYRPYEFRSISVKTDNVPTAKKKTKGNFEVIKTEKKEQKAKQKSTGSDLMDSVMAGIYESYGYDEETKPEKQEKKKEEPKKKEASKPKSNPKPANQGTGSALTDAVMAGIMESYGYDTEEKEEIVEPVSQEIKDSEEPPSEVPNYRDGGLSNLGLFRVAKSGPFKTEEDLDSVIAEIKRMIPQFPVDRLKIPIKVSDNLEAWGQFVNNVIKLYELAEEGTGYHEVFEAVVNKLLTDKEWNALYKEFTSRNGSFTDRETGRTINYKDATAHEAKEQLAEEFKDFKLGKKAPSQHQTRSYFQIIWDFIKKFFSVRPTIEQIFSKIDTGKFAKRELRREDRFAANYRLAGVPVEVKRDLLEGVTAYMLRNLMSSPKSLVSLDEIDETDESVYEPIKAQFQERIDTLTGAAENEKDENLKKNYLKSIDFIKYGLNNWRELVQTHKDFLRKFSIKFEQNDIEQTDERKEMQNRNDYLQDVFKTSGKKSASKSIRFLFGSLMEMKFNPEGKTITVDNSIAGQPIPKPSSIYMTNLVEYDDYMLKALDEFKGLNDFTQVKNKLKQLSGIAEIEAIKNAEKIKKLVATMDEEKAVWTSLYIRLFGINVNPEAAWNLRVKFHNYVSKHSPEPFVFIVGGGTSAIISSTKRSFFENIIGTIESSLRSQQSLLYSKVVKDGTSILVAKKEFQPTSLAEFTQKEDGKYPKVEKFIEYLGLSEMITPKLYKSLTIDERNKLNTLLHKIRNKMTEAKVAGNISIKSLDIFNYISKDLMDFLDEKLDAGEVSTQFYNINNEPQQKYITPSFASRLVTEINNVETRDELIAKFPNLDTYFAEDSIIMSKLFNKDGTRNTSFNISLGYMEGIKDLEEQEGTKTAKLEESDRYFLQFQASLSGLYYSIPADSETEWVFNFGEFVQFRENLLEEKGDEIIKTIFLPKLRSEINAVIEGNKGFAQLSQKHSNGREIGRSLRFFKDILQHTKDGKTSTAILDEIYKRLDAGESSEKILNDRKLKNKIIKAIDFYLKHEVAETKQALLDNRLVVGDAGGYYMQSLNGSFVQKYSGSFSIDSGVANMNESQFNSLVEYQKINSIIGNMETFKMVFGDPAQYKDFEKRAKSLFGPIEQTYSDKNGELNDWLNENKNIAVLGDDKVELAPNDWFRTDFSDHINERTVDDFTVVSTTTVNNLIDKDSEFAKTFLNEYEKTNESDGQSIGTLGFARHLLIKSGWRWTDEHEKFYQYDTALMRQELSQLPVNHPHYYNYNGNNELQELDKKIVEFYKENPPAAKLSPVKTLMPYVDEDGNQSLLKHSVHFMSYQVAKQFELLDTYVDLLKDKNQLLNFKSTKKVGLKLDNENKITSYYADPFTKNDLNSKGNPKTQIDLKTIGIQVETQNADDKHQTIGSQLTKDINLNLFENGIPVDFMKGEEISEKERKELWDLLGEEDKIKESENYAKVFGPQGTITTLRHLKMKNTLDRFTELGVKWNYSEESGIEYSIDDLSKIQEYIKDELLRLGMDENNLSNFELEEDLKAFKNPAETTPSYTTISNLLWAIADKSITSMSVNGKPYIQVSSAFFSKSRKATYKDESGKWVEVDNEADFDRLKAEGKKLVMTSSDLAFYSVNPETGETNPMEIYLPNIYLRKVNIARKAKGLKVLSEQELLDHLNKNPKLLEGIGFRIPTQATSSLEFFKIKGFLPEAFGDAVVVPSAITTKAGSDFDVDKLSTYLNNWKLGKDGLPEFEEFKDDNNSTPEQRFVSFIKSKEREYRVIMDEMKGSQEYKTISEIIDSNNEELEHKKSKVGNSKDEQESIYEAGLEIFHDLPLPVKQQYWDTEADYRVNGIEGAEKILRYLTYTDKWINEFENGTRLILPLKTKDGKIKEEVVHQAEVLPILENLILNYKDVLKAMGITEELINEYRSLKAANKLENQSLMDNFRFKVANLIAEFNGFVSFDDFSKLPMYLQNTKGAIENQYFQSIRNVLSSPNMFEALLSPASVQHIKDNKKAVFDALGKEVEAKELDYTRLVSNEYISSKRNQFAKGKYDIGIFAVAMTNFANSQITGIGISELGTYKDIDSMVMKLNEDHIDLPFSDIKMQEINGHKFIPISTVRDAEGKLTMDKISAYISGAVDVAKEPDIVEMGMHTELAGSYVLLERMGVRGKTAALFLYNPAIREFLKEYLFFDNKTYFGQSKYSKYKELVEGILDDFAGEESEYNSDYRFTDEQLASLIKKAEDNRKKGIPATEVKWTKEEKIANFHAFVNFLKVRMYSNHLLENIQASNHDTASIRNAHIITKKDLQLERAKSGNMIVKIDGDNVINGAEALREDTAVKNDIKLLKWFDSLFSNINLFALQRKNPKNALRSIAARMFDQNPFISNDDFVNAMKHYESAMIDSLVNTEVEVPGVVIENGESKDVYTQLYKFSKQFFSTKQPYNLKNRYDALREAYPTTFKRNYFLKNLQFRKDDNLGIWLMEFKKKPMNDDFLLKERITEGLIQMGSIDERNYTQERHKKFAIQMSEFYRALVYGAYIQFGIRFGRRSFLDLLPVNGTDNYIGLTDITKPALDKIDDADFSNLDEQVQRNSYYKKGIVPQKTQFSMHFLAPNEKGDYELEPKASWRNGKSKPPNKISQTFFGKVIGNQIVNHIHPAMIWAGYRGNQGDTDTNDVGNYWKTAPNIISIPAIKPEFLERKVVNGREIYKPKDVIGKMMKKGDYSFLFDQLYKKVGLENSSHARFMISKNKEGKESINLLYKPINKYGSRDFNEVQPLYETEGGTVVGMKSILNFPAFKELSDEELVGSTNDKSGKLYPINMVTKKTEAIVTPRTIAKPRAAQKEKTTIVEGKKVKTMDFQPSNIIKIAEGIKTTTIKSKNQADKIGIPVGETQPRMIGGNIYNITNRGYLTIEEAGGLQAMLASEGLDKVEALKFQQSKDWISGKGKLYVYDIKPFEGESSTEETNEVTPPNKPPIKPRCT